MSRTDRKLAELRAEMKTGVWKGVPDRLVPFWSDAQNVIFTARGVAKIQGWSSPLTKPNTIAVRGMGQFIDSGVQKLVWGDTDNLYLWDTISVTTVGSGYNGNLTGTATTPASHWSIETFGNQILATNGVDAPQINTGGGFVDLSDADFSTAEIFVRRGPHILAFNTSINRLGFVWNSADDLTSWTPSSANSAGDLIIRELNSEIIAAVPLGERVAVYGRDQMFLVAYLGAPNYFGYKPAVEAIGAISKKAVVPVSSKNYGLGRMGFWVTDGVNSRLIDDPAVREFFQEEINWDQASKVNGWHDEDNHQVVWFYPSVGGTGEVDKGVAYDYVNDTWTLLGYARTASMDRDVYTYPVAADSSGEIYFHNLGVDDDGSALTAWARSKTFDLDNPDHIKHLLNLRLDWSGTGLQFRIGTRNDLADPIVWSSYQNAAAGYALNNLRITGRYMALEVYSNQVGDDWELSGVGVYGKLGGSR